MSTALSTGRDATRSRTAILEAAERLFADRGFAGTSLGAIAAAAGLSRGTPSYFFGSKEQLYRDVLEQLFAEREVAVRAAFEPLRRWIRDEESRPLEAPLRDAVTAYLSFLRERPAFVRLLQREDLDGGRRLRKTTREANAMTDAFESLRRVSRTRGLRPFRVDDAVLLLVSLTFSPLAQGSTFMASLGRDLDDAAVRRAHIAFVVDQLLYQLSGRPSS